MPDDPLPATLTEAISQITNDREHGASWLARVAAQALAAASTFDSPLPPAEAKALLETLHSAAKRIAAARPAWRRSPTRRRASGRLAPLNEQVMGRWPGGAQST
ncbi:MAG TPA: hypothetical protein VKQ36_13355 [Ktedonobacterales bacterium]|nr:hypothetical protein [Ktedonobacterales bacterium]